MKFSQKVMTVFLTSLCLLMLININPNVKASNTSYHPKTSLLKFHHSHRVTRIRHYKENQYKRIKQEIKNDKHILNSKSGQYYLHVYKNFKSNEKYLSNLKKNKKEYNHAKIFVPTYKNGHKKANRKPLSIMNIYKNQYNGYVKNIKPCKIYKMHIAKYEYKDKIKGAKWIKKNNVFHVGPPTNIGIEITGNKFPNEYSNAKYVWLLSP